MYGNEVAPMRTEPGQSRAVPGQEGDSGGAFGAGETIALRQVMGDIGSEAGGYKGQPN